MKHKLESRLPEKKRSNLRQVDDTTLMEESEELKGLLMKVEEESEKVGLKPNIQKMKIMASGPITSWQIEGETVETVADFILWGSKIIADGDCSHEIKRCNFPGGSEVKASASNVGDQGSIPGSGRSPGKGNGTPLQYSCLENPMDGGTWLGYSPWVHFHSSVHRELVLGPID